MKVKSARIEKRNLNWDHNENKHSENNTKASFFFLIGKKEKIYKYLKRGAPKYTQCIQKAIRQAKRNREKKNNLIKEAGHSSIGAFQSITH